MKTQILKLSLFVLLGIFLGMTFFRCGNDAGIGADFDPTQYYTKEEIDTLLSQYYLKSEVDNLTSSIGGGIIYIQKFVGQNIHVYEMIPGSAAESDWRYASIAVPANGTLKNLVVNRSTFQSTGSIVLITVCVNGLPTPLSLQCTSTAGPDVKVNTTDIVNVNQGDLITLLWEETGGINPNTSFTVGFLFNTEN